MASALPPASVWLKNLGARHSSSHSTLLQGLAQVQRSLSSFRIRDSALSGVLGAKLAFVNLLYLSKFGFTVLVVHVILFTKQPRWRAREWRGVEERVGNNRR